MTGLVAGHFMNGIMDGIEPQLLGLFGQLELAGGSAVLGVHPHLQVLLGAVGQHLAQQLGELGGVLGLLIGGLLPVQADLRIALTVSDPSHAEIHTHLAALAVEVGHQLIENILLVLFGDIGVVLHGIGIDAKLVLGSQLDLALHLVECVLCVADGAFHRRFRTLIDITANLADPLLHNCILLKSFDFPKLLFLTDPVR